MKLVLAIMCYVKLSLTGTVSKSLLIFMFPFSQLTNPHNRETSTVILESDCDGDPQHKRSMAWRKQNLTRLLSKMTLSRPGFFFRLHTA